jgi:hypothetical protein
MLVTVRVVLMILAIICFLCAAVGITPPRGESLGWAGLALWALAAAIAVP